MKIALLGFEHIGEGKIKYRDEKMVVLTDKFSPKKVTPYFAEFIRNDFVAVDGIAVEEGKMLDLLIMDMEKMETRFSNSSNDAEKALVKKCLEAMEQEKPLCDVEFSDSEQEIMRGLAPLSFQPTLSLPANIDENDLIAKMLDKSDTMFFYTGGPQEVHAWLVSKGSDAVTCAGKIHSDLARGFIKAEIVNYDDFIKGHNLQEAKNNGFVKLVDRDYIIQSGDMLDIRFNV